MSSAGTQAHISAPVLFHAWRDGDGTVHAAVRLNEDATATLVFDSAADARAVAAACAAAAGDLDRLEAEGEAGAR